MIKATENNSHLLLTLHFLLDIMLLSSGQMLRH